MWTFFGLMFLTGIVQKGQLQDYWSTDELLSTPYFTKHMSRNRYQIILRFLHFADNESPSDTDRLWKIRHVYDHFLEKFESNITPSEHLSLDEGMLAWRGRLSFKVYNPQKPDKYGIKGYIVCESESGYMWKYDMYRGTGRKLNDIVTDLLAGTENKGYSIYMDNYYNSVALTQQFCQNHTHLVGTLRQNRGSPKDLYKAASKLARGQQAYAYTNDGNILVTHWKDKKVVNMISNKHCHTMQESRKRNRAGELVSKPECVLDYNQFMGGVDKADQMIKYFPFIRPTLKWTVKFVSYLMHIAMHNASVLYKKDNPRSNLSDLLKNCIRQIHMKHSCRPSSSASSTSSSTSSASSSSRPSYNDPASRLNGKIAQHRLVAVPATAKKTKPTRYCRVCSRRGKRSETRMLCASCDVPLHKGECYTHYHTLKDYTRV